MAPPRLAPQSATRRGMSQLDLIEHAHVNRRKPTPKKGEKPRKRTSIGLSRVEQLAVRVHIPECAILHAGYNVAALKQFARRCREKETQD